MFRRLAVLTVIAMVGLPVAASASPDVTAGTAPSPDATVVSARFGTAPPELTYRPDLVPVGARATVVSVSLAGKTTVLLAVHGLVPDRQYGAHVHTKPCGALPTDAGPHYQNVVDPVQPSTDPAYANADNEIWLDLTTGGHGGAVTSSTVDWEFGDRRGGSVVIHEHHTHTHPGEAGTAGARLACLSVAF